MSGILVLAVQVGSVVLGTAVAGVVTVVVGLAMGWVQRSIRRTASFVSRRCRADHRTIGTGWFGRDQGAQSQFLVTIKCAPSTSLRAPVRLGQERVARWVQAAFGNMFPAVPDYYLPAELVRFRTDANEPGGAQAFALAWPSGLLEATLPIAHTLDANGQPVIAVMDLIEPLIHVIQSIRDGGHSQVYGDGRLFHRKLDWYIGVSRALSSANGWTPWAGLVFPWQSPQGRATGMQPPMATPGFAQDRLVNMPADATAQQILVPALTDLLERSGYFGYDEAMADIQTAIDRLTTERAQHAGVV